MKRKRTISEESYYSIVDDYATKSVAKSYVELVDVDSNGKYVRLQNKSEKVNIETLFTHELFTAIATTLGSLSRPLETCPQS